MTEITALTAYNVPIVAKTFKDTKSAREWAETDGQRYGCARIVRTTENGRRTIWKPDPVEVQQAIDMEDMIYAHAQGPVL